MQKVLLANGLRMNSKDLKTPSVSVPVLSKATVSRVESISMYAEPLIRMPSFEAAPIPPKKASGTETTSAHGQDAIRKVSALTIQN